MRLPIQAAAVIRDTVLSPAVRHSPGLSPSGFASAHSESTSWSGGVLCACAPGPGHPMTTFADCPTNQCYWNTTFAMCVCGQGYGP